MQAAREASVPCVMRPAVSPSVCLSQTMAPRYAHDAAAFVLSPGWDGPSSALCTGKASARGLRRAAPVWGLRATLTPSLRALNLGGRKIPLAPVCSKRRVALPGRKRSCPPWTTTGLRAQPVHRVTARQQTTPTRRCSHSRSSACRCTRPRPARLCLCLCLCRRAPLQRRPKDPCPQADPPAP
jgi:hypothetical protein